MARAMLRCPSLKIFLLLGGISHTNEMILETMCRFFLGSNESYKKGDCQHHRSLRRRRAEHGGLLHCRKATDGSTDEVPWYAHLTVSTVRFTHKSVEDIFFHPASLAVSFPAIRKAQNGQMLSFVRSILCA